MPMGDLGERIRASRHGEDRAEGELVQLAYGELRRLAAGLLRRERSGHTLQPTALVHEAYLRLGQGAVLQPRDRAHFLALAGRAMRQVLVESARRRSAQKRGGGRPRVTLDEGAAPAADPGVDVLDLHDAIEALARHQPRQGRLAELRLFGGLDVREAARELGVSESTVHADWHFVRAWLDRELSEAEGP